MVYRSFKDLKNELFKPLNYYSSTFDKNFKMLQHAHPYFEIMYCNSGSFSISLINEKNDTKNVSLNAQDFIFIDAGIFHEVTIIENCNILNLEFVIDVPTESYYNTPMLFPVQSFIKQSAKFSNMAKDPFRIILAHDDGSVRLIFNKLLDLLNNSTSVFDKEFLIQPTFYSFLGEMGKDGEKTHNVNKSGIIHIKKAIDFIRKNFQNPITAEDVATHVGINRIYLQRLFKINLEQSILKTINRFRIERACSLLKTSNADINQIWKYSGFNNRQQFNYEFMSHVGTTPTEYRKNQAYTPSYHVVDDYIQDFWVEK